MRHTSLGWIMIGLWIGGSPLAAHADYLSNARASMQKGDLKAAQIDLRNAVRNDPQSADAHYWLGRVSLELGDPIVAEREATAAKDRGFDPHQAIPLLSQSLLAQKKFQDLLDTLQPGGKDPSLDASVLVARGYAQLGLQRQDEARQSFTEAEKVAPDAVEPLLADARLALAHGNVADAQAKIDRAVAAQPKSAEALLAKAQMLRLKNDAAGALTLLDKLLAEQPSVMQARLDRAALELSSGKSDAAKADVDVVLKAMPSSVQAIYLRAVLEAQSNNYKAADADLEQISPFLARIQRGYYLQAIVKQQLGQLEQAEQAAQKYLGRAPNDPAAYKMVAKIQFAKRQPDQVIETLGKIAGSGKADAETYDLLGRAYATSGRAAEAVQAFRQAEALAPNDVGVRTRLASAQVGMGDADTAVDDLEHTLELAPKMPAVGEALFAAALATGDLQKAADAVARVRAAQGDTAIVGNLQGLYQMAQLDFAGAKDTFSGLVRKYPDFTPVKVNLARVDAMLGDKVAAEKILTDILAGQPAAEPALSIMAADYTQSGRLPEAIDLLERAHRAAPNQLRITVSLGDLYIRAHTPQKALDLVAAEKGAAAHSIELLDLTAAADLGLGQKKEAMGILAEILKQDGNAVAVRRRLALLMVEAGDYENARSVISAGIAANPRDYQLYQDYVLIDLKAVGIDTALATAARLTTQNQDFAALKALKGDAYMAAKRPVDAAAAFLDANNAAPSDLLVSRAAGALTRSGRANDANALLQDWLDKHPDDLVAAAQLSEISIVSGKLDDAARDLELVLKHTPHDPVALNNLAWVYQQQGKDAQARDLARQAYVLSPTAQTADTLGWILTTGGNPHDGLALLRQASGEGASDPRILYHYAVALKDSGDKDEARKQLQTVVGNKAEFKEKVEAQKLLDAMARGT